MASHKIDLQGLMNTQTEQLLSAQALSKYLGVCHRTLKRMEKRQEIPAHIKISGKSYWHSGQVADYILKRVHKAQEQSEREAQRINKYKP